ncbi:MAG: hypothetical protein JXM70_01855 [Pirellulales bacterium]|nr:hypothetical protein [Pirellulales bacterium]
MRRGIKKGDKKDTYNHLRIKDRMSRELADILKRLGTTQEFWDRRLEKLRSKFREKGHYFATQTACIKEIAARRGIHHVDNVAWVG